MKKYITWAIAIAAIIILCFASYNLLNDDSRSQKQLHVENTTGIEPIITVFEMTRWFEDEYLNSDSITQWQPGAGYTGEPPLTNKESLDEYELVDVRKEVNPEGDNLEQTADSEIWRVTFDVKPKPAAEGVEAYHGWAAGNGVVEGDWVRGKVLYLKVTLNQDKPDVNKATDNKPIIEVLGTGI